MMMTAKQNLMGSTLGDWKRHLDAHPGAWDEWKRRMRYCRGFRSGIDKAAAVAAQSRSAAYRKRAVRLHGQLVVYWKTVLMPWGAMSAVVDAEGNVVRADPPDCPLLPRLKERLEEARRAGPANG